MRKLRSMALVLALIGTLAGSALALEIQVAPATLRHREHPQVVFLALQNVPTEIVAFHRLVSLGQRRVAV